MDGFVYLVTCCVIFIMTDDAMNQALKIKSNYSVRPDDDTRKMYEHVGVLFVM
jgi:hypothetical protein